MEQDLHEILNEILESSRIGDHMSCEEKALQAIKLIEEEPKSDKLKKSIRHFKSLDNSMRFSPNQVVYILKQFNNSEYYLKLPMKLLFIILWLPFLGNSQTCPAKGDGSDTKIIAADIQKNRSYCPSKELAHGYDISILLKDAIKDTSLIYVDAFITSVKVSGPESCECHINDPNFLDYHIYIAATNTKDGKQNQIVEVSRYSRQLNHSINFSYIKSLVGHKVRIYGYTFLDQEHKSAIGDWRAGIEEIHPVFYIDKIN